MADEKQTFTVAGYKFATKEEAQDAKDELNAIKYLSSKTDGKDPKQAWYNQRFLLFLPKERRAVHTFRAIDIE